MQPCSRSLRSHVCWALLGLIIERSGYGYQLLKRFEDRYGPLLQLSGPSHIYQALDALTARSFVEATSAREPGRRVRQLRPSYQATRAGERAYGDWLIGHAAPDYRLCGLSVRELMALASRPELATAVLKCWEEACLRERSRLGQNDAQPVGLGGLSGVAQRLTQTESRLASDSALAWIRCAREELDGLARSRLCDSDERSLSRARSTGAARSHEFS